MTQYLPPNLLALFAPREPIPYLPPVDVLPYEKKTAGYTGVAAFVNQFEDPTNAPPPTRIETREERQERRRREKAEQVAYQLEQDIALWNPSNNPNATTDPYKTLFVARVNYDTTEAKLLREFEMYGDIRKTCIIFDNTKDARKPRGYAFIEYERERDMHSAYKHADGKKIDGRRVLVDVERGRTVKGWLPRRLGGGLGGTRRGGPEVNVKHSGREEPSRPEERYNMNRDRDRGERPEHRRSRSRSRERRRRSRSRSRDRHRRDRHKRDRSRDRDRTREHEANAGGEKTEGAPEPGPEAAPDVDARRRRRSRSRDRDRRRRRSRSRDRKDRDSRRDKDKERDRDRDRDSRRERDRPREEEEVPNKEEPPAEINQEMYGHENNGGFEEDYRNYNNMQNQTNYEGY